VDLDPGPGVENHMSSGSQDLYISKYNSNGDYVWSRVWGGPKAEGVNSICIDSSGNIYMTGSFAGTSDFDPGPGIDSRTADSWDAFLNKYDADGNYQWVVTWSGSDSGFETGTDVVVDSFGEIYVAGYFTGTVDFDPGPGIEEYTSNGGNDISLSKFDPDGNLQWALAIGGVDNDEGQSVTVDIDNNPCIGGNFMDTVDFDPGVGEQNWTSTGFYDVFLAKFDPYGNYLWVDTWGGADWENLYDIEFDSDSGSLYATGYFRGVVDFNPGLDMDIRTSNGENDIFVISLQSDSGAFQWANTWGAGAGDSGYGLAVSPLGSVVVSGQFSLTVDFNPGAGIDNHTSNGSTDGFICQFDSAGSFNWARTWGGSETDYDYEVNIAQSDGDIYTVGRFRTTVDMNPGPEIDNHVSNGETDYFLMKFLSTGLW